MTLAETAELLTLAATYDRRTIGEADVYAWQAALDDIDCEDAKAAVIAHYRTSGEWLMPVQIRTSVAKIRAQRIADAGPEPVPDADPDDVVAWQRQLRANRRAAASGQRGNVYEITGGVS